MGIMSPPKYITICNPKEYGKLHTQETAAEDLRRIDEEVKQFRAEIADQKKNVTKCMKMLEAFEKDIRQLRLLVDEVRRGVSAYGIPGNGSRNTADGMVGDLVVCYNYHDYTMHCMLFLGLDAAFVRVYSFIPKFEACMWSMLYLCWHCINIYPYYVLCPTCH